MNKMISKKDAKIIRKMLALATEPEEAMNYDEFLGFLFGLAITPDLVVPSEWLPIVFGEEMITVDSEKEANQCINSLLKVVNDLVEQFQRGRLQFPFDLNDLDRENSLLPIHEWTVGFLDALELRPEFWFEEDLPEDMSEEEEELMLSLSVIEGIVEPSMAAESFGVNLEDEAQSGQLVASLFVMLPTAVESIMIHAAMLEGQRQQLFQDGRIGPPQVKATPKIGRNEPCPCGSGKKYKKCCLTNEKIIPFPPKKK